MVALFRSVLVLAATAAIFCVASIASADVHVRGHDRQGYYRQDGTYVRPTHVREHWRSDPDGDASNNWSARGNRNPYTGKRGYQNVPRTKDRALDEFLAFTESQRAQEEHKWRRERLELLQQIDRAKLELLRQQLQQEMEREAKPALRTFGPSRGQARRYVDRERNPPIDE